MKTRTGGDDGLRKMLASAFGVKKPEPPKPELPVKSVPVAPTIKKER